MAFNGIKGICSGMEGVI